MGQIAIENCSIVSAKESLPEFEINAQQAGFLPSVILSEIHRGKSGKVFYPRYTQEANCDHAFRHSVGKCKSLSPSSN